MRLSLRFLVPLLLVMAAFAYAAVPLADRLTLRWFMRDMHMNPDDAVRAHLDLGPKLSIGTHYGCFQLTDEGIDEPLRELAAARLRHGVAARDFIALETGETYRLAA